MARSVRHTRRVVPSQPVNWQGPKGGKHKKQYSLPTRFTGPLGTNGVLTHLIKGIPNLGLFDGSQDRVKTMH
ncbi:hypothetical protein MGG_15605 [Pyricularia oryzae 70-15]|uniref:Uncharacterized protein n=2 Tax=Pyricularia oryzae TaxID=318829 RepID=G4MVL1_PYRO7|nr:uncharacterized protein MGG_15605 [Pyricularia oryzae 70-15]EHA54120.1 hypothetical protein MGG_15605 [Pyricularia oryzae 70-15]